MIDLQEVGYQGLTSLIPATAKSAVFRVTRAKPVTGAVAAIKESTAGMGTPFFSSWVMSWPQAIATEESIGSMFSEKRTTISYSNQAANDFLRFDDESFSIPLLISPIVITLRKRVAGSTESAQRGGRFDPDL